MAKPKRCSVTPFSAPIVGEVEFTSTDCSCLWKIIISILPCQQPAHNKHKTGSKKPCLAQISSNCHKHKLNVFDVSGKQQCENESMPYQTWPSLLLPHVKNTVTRNIDVASNWHGGSMLGSRDSELT
jgi:hypothetical protein